MMKNKSTIARLLAEEDIHVVNKKMDTAYFNIKKRELGLPIWKDEISKVEEELMVCHEIGHALWTSMDMIEKSTARGLNSSFVNILEDARIEKFVKRKYPGSVNLFKKGYAALAARDFFGIANEGVNSCNLIDRINLFFKEQDGVEFSDEEKVFVDRAAKLETEDEVLDLAEELYKYMEDNPETDKHDDGESGGESMGSGESAPSDTGDNGEKSSEESGDTSNDLRSTDDSTVDNSGSNVGDDDGDDDGDAASGSAGESNDAGDDTESGADTSKGSEVGGDATSSAPAGVPEAKTDKALSDALKSLVDGNANEKVYGRIPKVDSSEFIVDYKTVVTELGANYSSDDKWVENSLAEVKEFKNDSKKTVNYMVKEFEMKKSADQYARAATSKTGTLDMGALHTYKFNDDLFKKVTTLPGATNHGMVMVLDWSGSMCDNLKGTIEQLLQLVMFCRRTKIPFEVFAFTSCYKGLSGYYSRGTYVDVNYGEIAISDNMSLLNFFSSKMSAAEEEKMMHYLWMIGKRYGQRTYEDWSVTGFPVNPPSEYSLGGTPLNDAIVVLMDFLPKYKKAAGVQKINTIFLTDGASNQLPGIKDNNVHGDFYQGFTRENLLIDPVTNKRYEFGLYGQDVTDTLLKALKGRVSGMNVVGFFLAGSGRKGAVNRNTWRYILMGSTTTTDAAMAEMRKNKVVVLESKGYDQYYILPGGAALAVENDGLDDKLVGASKGKLKTAFAKSNKGRIQSRVLLNKFVGMVA